jgi:2-(1,2-epoxy-1,2-dihydrophenyl)acetyl-CoA isomerase
MSDSPGYETIIWNQQGSVLTLTLNRPERLNAFNADMFRDLEQATLAASNRDDVRAVVFTGASRAFSSGADLTSVTEYHSDAEGDSLELGVRQVQAVFDKVATLPKPV